MWISLNINTWVTAAAYAEDPNPCLREHNASLVYRVTLPCDYIKDEVWFLPFFIIAVLTIWYLNQWYKCAYFQVLGICRDAWWLDHRRFSWNAYKNSADHWTHWIYEWTEEKGDSVLIRNAKCWHLHNTTISLLTFHSRPSLKEEFQLRAGGSVQHYFYVALEAIWKQMNTVIRKLRIVGLFHIGELSLLLMKNFFYSLLS